MNGTRDAASNWERDWQEHVKDWGFRLGLSSKNLFHHREDDRISVLTHGDDFVLAGPTERVMAFENKMTCVYSIKATIIGPWIIKEHQDAGQGRCTGDRKGSCINMIPDTLTSL